MSLEIFDDWLRTDALYLLDEPEVSLSPQNQVFLAQQINFGARLMNNQYIIATHSLIKKLNDDYKINYMRRKQLMNTVVYLTRHGQTEWNIERRLQGRGNSPLTQSGIARAMELRDRIKDIDIDVIYSSPIERALDTANIIKGEKNIQVITNDGLMEMCFGDYEGRRTDEVMKENPEWNIDFIMKGDVNLCAPNGETLGCVRTRISETMDKLIEQNRGKTIFVVAHGITLKALMYYFKDEEVNTEVMGQATLTKITVNKNNNFNIEFKNDDSHFTVKGQKLGW